MSLGLDQAISPFPSKIAEKDPAKLHHVSAYSIFCRIWVLILEISNAEQKMRTTPTEVAENASKRCGKRELLLAGGRLEINLNR